MSEQQANQMLKDFAAQCIANPRENANSPDSFDCDFKCPKNGVINFTADPNDITGYGREVYRAILAGYAGEIQPLPEPDWLEMFTNKQSDLVAETWAIPNVKYDSLSDEQKDELSAYRDELTALAYGETVGEFTDWPNKPEFI